jgi:hypothetical protein
VITAPCSAIAANLGALFECSESGRDIRIRTPYLYPDGDVIDLFMTTHDQPQTVTDYGETLRWLAMQAPSFRRTVKQQALIQDTCATLGVEFYKGMLQKRVEDESALAVTIMLLGQAAVRVSDLWFTFRSRSFESMNDEVAELLEARQVENERNVSLVGRSGSVWKVEFHTRTPKRTSLVKVLSTGNRAAARKMAEHALATWYDLSNLKLGPEGISFVSLFDDSVDVWSDEDFKLVEEFSEIVYWSNPDELLASLAA